MLRPFVAYICCEINLLELKGRGRAGSGLGGGGGGGLGPPLLLFNPHYTVARVRSRGRGQEPGVTTVAKVRSR